MDVGYVAAGVAVASLVSPLIPFTSSYLGFSYNALRSFSPELAVVLALVGMSLPQVLLRHRLQLVLVGRPRQRQHARQHRHLPAPLQVVRAHLVKVHLGGGAPGI
eukprot:574411-Prorocentrum_minimum.AAC.2